MISLFEYFQNPCGTLSIPYWKARRAFVLENTKIMQDRDFSPAFLCEYTDARFFRLSQDLRDIPFFPTDSFALETASALRRLLRRALAACKRKSIRPVRRMRHRGL